jgi:hypothetical protein
LHCIRVELPDGNYALVPEAEEGGADAELQYMEVSEDTTSRLTVLTKASPGALTQVFLNSYGTICGCLCIYVQELE